MSLATTNRIGLIERYRDHLPFAQGDPIVSLLEGSTPLIEAPYLSKLIGASIWLKIEGANPTGSFKDRGMTCAVSAALRSGDQAIICASTGNTAASAAAYAVRAGLQAVVLVPAGKIASGKLAQALIYGAKVISLEANFDQAATLARQLAEAYPITLVNSVNDFRLQGQKTAAFEILEEIPDLDLLAIPIGNGGNITAYHLGFREMGANPLLWGFQAQGSAPLVAGHPILSPETVASAIRIGAPARRVEALEALSVSGGQVRAVTDEEILAAYSLVASKEGVFCEPASAASIAGLLRYGTKAQKVVCVLTGNGLKDPQTALTQVAAPLLTQPDFQEIAAIIFE